MKLRFTPRATQDLIDIADYIRERNPAASLRVRAAILESLQNLILFPEVGRRQTVEGVRKLVTRKYPYLIFTRSIRPPTRPSFSPSSTPRVSGSIRMRSEIKKRELLRVGQKNVYVTTFAMIDLQHHRCAATERPLLDDDLL